jgi:glyoxylate carboligase
VGFYRIYGYPGDGINGIMGAFDRIGDKLEFIQVRHEEMAAFMACAHAKFTGETGICLATSGPGAVHLLTVCTMRRWITFLSSPSSVRQQYRRWAARTNKKSICKF